MKKTVITTLAVAAIFGLNGCGNSPESSPEAKTYSKTSQQVWEGKCFKCHGKNAEGMTDKKTPPMNDRQAGELELDLFDVKNDGLNQSSGTQHDKMAHNMKKLMEKGWDYDPKSMAEFIEKSFYKMPSKSTPQEAAPAAVETAKEVVETAKETVETTATEAVEAVTEAVSH